MPDKLGPRVPPDPARAQRNQARVLKQVKERDPELAAAVQRAARERRRGRAA